MEEVKAEIISRQTKNQNKCGTTMIYLMDKFSISQDEMKKILNQLYADKLITIREGINNQLIFLRR